ncbi:MAG: phosphoenolpyruvate--protein phosphotransferase, partial [Acidobacteria bacterium]|nr:phosphoenolpyruvate--protein phosphotransferase [Acidobacteriota bacterium]
LPNGVHARPAGALEAITRGLASDISVLNERTGCSANAKSVLGIVSLDIRGGDRCRFAAAGGNEQDAMARLRQFLEVEFPRCDEPLAPIPILSGEIRLPPVLEQARPEFVVGTPAAPGIGQGCAVWLGGLAVPDSIPKSGVTAVAAEIRLLDAALVDLERRYDARVDTLRAGVEADVLRAHRSVARDPEFRARLQRAVRERACTAAGAIVEAERYFTAMLSAAGSLMLRERALDVRDVCFELLKQIYGDVVQGGDVHLTGDAICLAEILTPGRFLALDRARVRGLVLTHGGTTSHTIILARSFGIPALVSVAGLDGAALDGRELVLDADLGILVTHLTDGARRYYNMERRRLEGRHSRLRRLAGSAAVTSDGQHVDIAANISAAAEVAPAVGSGADGVGLFRTEMLFADREQAPTEDDQFDEYRRAVTDAGGRAVIIRTLDTGGDKPIPYLQLPREDNPFLGFRAVRLYPAFEQLFRDQVRALARASAFGRLKVMVPMVSGVEEVTWVKRVINDEQRRLAAAGVPYDARMAVGAMIEVPSAAFLLDRLCQELDFFSLGTNDLLQYFCAVDRANRSVASLYDPLAPAFLRFLNKIVDDIHASGSWVGVCGEMAGQVRCLPFLIGLGVDELSMAAPRIPEIKAAVSALSAGACRALLREALACSTASEVGRLVDGFA